MPNGWKSLKTTDQGFTRQMAMARQRCEVSPMRIDTKCGAHASEVVEFSGDDNLLHLAAVCADCRRRFFGRSATEKRADTLAFRSKQVLAFELGPPGEPWKPKAKRR
jgi:hypothetical protein